MHVFGLQEEAGVPGGKPHRHIHTSCTYIQHSRIWWGDLYSIIFEFRQTYTVRLETEMKVVLFIHPSSIHRYKRWMLSTFSWTLEVKVVFWVQKSSRRHQEILLCGGVRLLFSSLLTVVCEREKGAVVYVCASGRHLSPLWKRER